MTATLNPALRDFWQTPARNRVLYGGRASSKSWDAAGVALFGAQAKPLKIMCVRQLQARIDDSVYTLLKSRIDHFGMNGLFDVQRNTIKGTNGSQFIFYGLWRHIEEIKSTEGVDILWIEEAHSLTEEQWKILEPTIRKEGSQVWVIFNPRLVTDFAYKRFVLNPPPNTIVRQINYDENPFLSQTMLRIIEAAKAEDEGDYRHVYLGEPNQDDDAVIIKRSWILAAVDAHVKLGIEPTGKSRIGFDVADDGDDKNAFVEFKGSLAVHAEEWDAGEDELVTSATRVWSHATTANADIDYDSIGVGAFAGSQFNALNEPEDGPTVDHYKFNAAGAVFNPDANIDPSNDESALNKDFYANLKAQAWWEAARRFRNTYNAVTKDYKFKEEDMLFISSKIPHLNKLVDELSTPRKDFALNGKSKVESKKNLAKRDVKSPNIADAFIAGCAPREYAGYDWVDAI